MTGNDGNLWEISQTKNGTYRWIRSGTNEANPVAKPVKTGAKSVKPVVTTDEKVVKMMKDIMDKRVRLVEFDMFSTTRKMKFPNYVIDRLVYVFLDKVCHKYVDMPVNMRLFSELQKDKKKYAEIERFLGELWVFLAGTKESIFMYIYGAPGENAEGYAIWYENGANNGPKWIFKNNDGTITSLHRAYNHVVKEFTAWMEANNQPGEGLETFHLR